jgi:antirestriction protein
MPEQSPERREPSGSTEPEAAAQPERLQEDRPKIWVGSLLDYNDGVLHGEWIDAAREAEELEADIQAMLDTSPTAARSGEVAEEWGIFDYDGFGPARIYEHDDLRLVSRVARGIAEHGPAFGAWADVMEGDEEALDQFADNYLGHFESVEAYAAQLVDDLGYERLLDEAAPGSLRAYVTFDTAALARDMEAGGEVHVIRAADGGIWLFRAY